MSIYPREIKKGEDVNIHFSIECEELPVKEQDAKIIIEIDSEESRIVLSKNVKLKSKLNTNHYFRYKTFDEGKHVVTAYLLIEGEKIFSGTKDNDFFKVIGQDSRFIDLADYLRTLSPETSYDALLKDSIRILENNEKEKLPKTRIGKKFQKNIKENTIETKNFRKVLIK